MTIIMKIAHYLSFIIWIAAIGYTIELIRGILIFLFKKDKKVLKEFFSTFDELAKGSIFKYTIVFLIIIIITILSSPEITFYLGLKDLQTLPNGTYTYYVNMKKVSSGKSYFEPAIITKDYDCDEDDEGKTRCYTYYYIERIYFANGGYITFDDDNIVEIEKYSQVIDHKGIEYEVELLNKHAYIAGVIESHPSWYQIAEIAYLLLFEMFCWLVPLYRISKEKDKKDVNQEEEKKQSQAIILTKDEEKLKKLLQIIDQDSEKLYEINKKYKFTNNTLTDSYDAFKFSTSMFMNYSYMSKCKEIYEDEERVTKTFEKSLNDIITNLAINSDHLNLLKGMAEPCYEYFEEKEKEISENPDVNDENFYELWACVYISGVNDPEKMGDYIDTEEFERFKNEVANYLKNAMDKMANENLVI